MSFEQQTPANMPEQAITIKDVDNIAKLMKAVAHDNEGLLDGMIKGLPHNLQAALGELTEQLDGTPISPLAIKRAKFGFVFAHSIVKVCFKDYEPPIMTDTFMRVQVRRAMQYYRTTGNSLVHLPDVADVLRDHAALSERLLNYHLLDKPGNFGAQVLLRCVSPSLQQ